MTGEAEFRKLVQEHTGMTDEEYCLDKPFSEIKLDSLDVLELLIACEDEWDIDLHDHVLAESNSLGDLYGFVVEALGQRTHH